MMSIASKGAPLSLTARIRVIDRANRRSVKLAATLRYDGLPFNTEIRDLSVSGFRAKTSANLEPGDRISVNWGSGGTKLAVVARQAWDGYGCFFVHELTEDVVLTAETVDTVGVLPLPKPAVEQIGVRWSLAVIIGTSLVGWALVTGIGVAALLLLD
jgi:hypothetical protein